MVQVLTLVIFQTSYIGNAVVYVDIMVNIFKTGGFAGSERQLLLNYLYLKGRML